MNEYLTIQKQARAEYEIQKSLFVAYTAAVSTELAAQDFIQHIKKKHFDATHNCSAYTLGFHDDIQKADDDGEPSGTAGRPILDVLRKKSIKNAVIVVTRYFGGIKLGAGGLTRAYGKSAILGLQAAGLITKVRHVRFTVSLDYTYQGGLENQLINHHFILRERIFTERVSFTVLARHDCQEEFIQLMNEQTNGTGQIKTCGEEYVDEIPTETN